ncbi:fungal-specific transcription factor domain-containing protein [Stachybotrys elegans]|uniref:Fungal-specific transcription factor domain-containing protein n=1 Tax=Stachybotrys elegans TaxID=80388 RepID=A0A8K0T3R0_9HYPO|nr:fungal-specific transcription factor domain-containing protein [Stachybotrys elegans]
MAAVSQPVVKAKSASKAKNGTPKAKSQMHRRSRTGCYTCRLRRKKCDEGNPLCTACKHLGLQCEYKRPMWWSDNEARRQHKDDIKMIIKRKKLSEKTAHPIRTTVSSPPSLSHSLPTSATFTDPLDRTRSGSMDSHFSTAFNFNSPPSGNEYGAYAAQAHPDFIFDGFSPYEIDVKTERQMFVNDVPTLKESHTSTFSTYQTPPPPGTVLPSGPLDPEWSEQVQQQRKDSLAEENLDVNFFDFSHGPTYSSTQIKVELDDNDQKLLDHFIQAVLPTIFPILESNQHGSVGSDLILPALQSNNVYLHCCLSVAAQHLKSSGNVNNTEDIDQDIMRHRYATIWSLCESLKRDENHQQILEATLWLIFFQCIVGRLDDGLLDIAWHQHFQAAINLVQKLDLPRLVLDPNTQMAQPPFNMTLTSWIDILGATMQGVSPTFAHTYREKHLSQVNHQLGLRELMGCDDRVMYLISEIACLESLKRDGMDDFTLCQHVSALGEQISLTEANETGPKVPYNANGSLSPKQLSKNITMAFRIAARIYLCSLVPGFSPTQPSPMALVEKLTNVLQYIPSGNKGYDRSLVWVYLIGGSISLPGSSFRAFFEDRVAQLGEQSDCGSFGRMVMLLRETWMQNDTISQASTPGSTASEAPYQYIHWRDVMRMKGWEYLLL